MKLALVVALVVSSLMACVAPVKPVPPIGCTYSDAVLVTKTNSTCYWVFMNCKGY